MGCGSSQTETNTNYTYYTATGSDYANYNYCNYYYQDDSRDHKEKEDAAGITDWKAYKKQRAYYNDTTVNPTEASDCEGFSDYTQWRKQLDEKRPTHKYQDFSDDNQKQFVALITRFNEKQRRHEEERRKKHLVKSEGVGKKKQAVIVSKRDLKKDTEESSTKLENDVVEDKPVVFEVTNPDVVEDKPVVIEETTPDSDSIPEPELPDSHLLEEASDEAENKPVVIEETTPGNDFIPEPPDSPLPMVDEAPDIVEDHRDVIEETTPDKDSIPEPEDCPVSSKMLEEASENIPIDEPGESVEEKGNAGFEDFVSLVLRMENLKSPAARQGQLSIRVLDTRKQKKPDFVSPRPKFEGCYVDTKFSKEVALGDKYTKSYEWKRPKEIYPDLKISLFHGGSSIDDVDQGVFGCCYLMAVMAGLAQSPSLMKQILPPDAYDVKAGLFHCRLWKYGCWYDIYIDDMLPCSDRGDGTYQLVGCKSGSYKGEMWIAFMEKVFAKYLGSYPAMEGGQPSFAYRCLTGGFTEWLAYKHYTEKFLSGPTYLRISNALQCGTVVTASVGSGTVPGAADPKECREKGLVPNHAYTVTATAIIKLTDTHEEVELVKLRNPWAHKEWTGPWSDNSPEWDRTSEQVRMSMRVIEDEGEFWMEWSEFWRLFDDLHLCSSSPDFDHDGITDGLEEVSVIYGQWSSPDTTGGWKDPEKNPHFQFTVPSTSEDPVYMVMELSHPKQSDSDWVEMRNAQMCNVIVKDEECNMVSDNDTYSTPPLCIFITLKPGASYALTPAKYFEDTDGEFMIRLFTSDPITVRPHNSSVPKRR